MTVEVPTGKGRRYGTSNHAPFDRWFRYAAGFATDTSARMFDLLTLDAGAVTIDPFAGSAVGGTTAVARGLGFAGVEAHPMIAELATLKLSLPQPSSGLTQAAEATVERAKEWLASEFTPVILDGEQSLVAASFESSVLTDLIAIREAIKAAPLDPWYLHLKWALLGALRECACVRVGWPYQRPNVASQARFTDGVARFRGRVEMFGRDIDDAVPSVAARPHLLTVVAGDSRSPSSWTMLETGSAQGCVTSPPYLNNFDYADATRLEAYFWGTARNWSELTSKLRGDMLIATTQQSSRRTERAALAALREVSELERVLLPLHTRLRKARAERRRGKEYDQVLPAYFVGMLEVFERLHSLLEPGARMVWLIGDSAPYGVYIDTPRLLTTAASARGFDLVSDDILRQRGLRWVTNRHRGGDALCERLVIVQREGGGSATTRKLRPV